ncbi:nitroreductase family deazaflavin-dependent oxidoreductase [Actinopolymorpha sp. B9G3]|uniref:nitroreductase family deazaflavin-dependent oxidoreductase n=1 Tax=Actinopolymorpha sp. B9G3 TaxID=3158970 RepID=UPI0032D97BD5
MAKRFQQTRLRRTGNRAVTWLTRRGWIDRHTYLLTVAGRRTGQPRTTPVTLVENVSGRYVVAPYGPVQWVRNVRAAGQVMLQRGGRVEPVHLRELGPAAAAPVLREYLRTVPIVRPYFDVRPGSALADFEAEADRHPVFEIRDAPGGS